MTLYNEIPQRYVPQSGDRIDVYTVERILGEGSFGTVCKVSAGKEIYALKLLKLWSIPSDDDRKDIVQRFDLEYETGRIKSDYLVSTLATGSTYGNPYIVMEYQPCGDLRAKMHGNMSVNNINNYARDILLGLSALHTNGKVHRDLKPDNVLIGKTGKALLTDFGIAGHRNFRLSFDAKGKAKKTFFGTIPYMPSEQMAAPNNKATILDTTDIFSFGATIFELFTLRYPFGEINSDSDVADYCKNVRNEKMINNYLLKKVASEKWVEIVEKCLKTDYKKRFQNVSEILDILDVSVPQKSDYYLESSDDIAFEIMQGEQHGRIYNISELLKNHARGLLTMGREDDKVCNDIKIKEDMSSYISRKHATIEKLSGNIDGWFIKDGQWNEAEHCWKPSKNGTFVNGSQLLPGERVALMQDDKIYIGDASVKVILKCYGTQYISADQQHISRNT